MHLLETEGTEQFFGARVSGRFPPGHLDWVSSAPPAPTGEQLGDTQYRCANGLIAAPLEP